MNMKYREAISELEHIKLRLYRLRMKNKSAKWFTGMVRSIEHLVSGMILALNEIVRGLNP